jgi:hypothetical protein
MLWMAESMRLYPIVHLPVTLALSRQTFLLGSSVNPDFSQGGRKWGQEPARMQLPQSF